MIDVKLLQERVVKEVKVMGQPLPFAFTPMVMNGYLKRTRQNEQQFAERIQSSPFSVVGLFWDAFKVGCEFSEQTNPFADEATFTQYLSYEDAKVLMTAYAATVNPDYKETEVNDQSDQEGN